MHVSKATDLKLSLVRKTFYTNQATFKSEIIFLGNMVLVEMQIVTKLPIMLVAVSALRIVIQR